LFLQLTISNVKSKRQAVVVFFIWFFLKLIDANIKQVTELNKTLWKI